MSDGMDTTVELDREEVLAVLQRTKELKNDLAEQKVIGPNKELRDAIATIKKWAEDNEQWLVVLAPWGMHHYGVLTEEQVELILKRFSSDD